MYFKKYYAISLMLMLMLGMTGCGGGGSCGASVAFGAIASNTCAASTVNDISIINAAIQNNSTAAVVAVVLTSN